MANGIELFNLSGRTALVTGASRGIGQALALALAEAGADIVAVSRSTEALEDVRKSVSSLGRRCDLHACDVADVSAVQALFDQLANDGVTADILVNNAGIEDVRASSDVDEALWDRIVDTNLKGAFFVAQGFANALIGAGRTGSIINLGSLTSAVGVPTATPYTSSKSGILGMTRALSTEWSPKGIRVNAIGPGYFRTDLTEAFYQNDDWQAAMLGKIPMNRFGDLKDLAGAAIFLASDASVYVTGQILYVDGGYLASI